MNSVAFTVGVGVSSAFLADFGILLSLVVTWWLWGLNILWKPPASSMALWESNNCTLSESQIRREFFYTSIFSHNTRVRNSTLPHHI